jgi:hypothetical protein
MCRKRYYVPRGRLNRRYNKSSHSPAMGLMRYLWMHYFACAGLAAALWFAVSSPGLGHVTMEVAKVIRSKINMQ